MSSKKNIRDFTESMPEDHVCPLCGLDNKDCKCIKYNCKCDILALNCIWPDCICSKCLQVSSKCRCSYE